MGATALALVLGAPAFAQTVINQPADPTIPVTIVETDSNSAVVFGSGPLVTSVESQVATATYNTIGSPGYPGSPQDYVGVTAGIVFGIPQGYTINQAAGTYLTGAAPGTVVAGSVKLTASNLIGAVAFGPEVSTALAGGNQFALTAVNTAFIAPAPPTGDPTATPSTLVPSTGSLTQVVGNAFLDSVNRMFAVVTNGTAIVDGLGGVGGGGFQTAIGTLNTGGVFLTPPTAPATGDATDLTLLQKLTAPNTVIAVNSAIANSIASTSSIFDPTVENIAQTSTICVNQLSPVTGAASATMGLDGEQNGITPPLAGAPQLLTATLGNTAVAYTGAVNVSTYNLFSAVPGNGAASVSGVTQNASFGLDNIFGGAGVNIVLSNTTGQGPGTAADGFFQQVDGTSEDVVGPSGPFGNVAPFGEVINNIVARSDVGSASISGANPFVTIAGITYFNPTQSFTNQQNSISTGGWLAGTATQTANDINDNTSLPGGTIVGPVPGVGPGLTVPAGYANVAIADVNTGPASITNVSQSMTQSLNTVAAGTLGSALNLTQSAGTTSPVVLGSNNVQLAYSGNGSATISGALQVLNTSVNVAALGSNSGTINQQAVNVTLTNTNILSAQSTFNNSTNGTQIANSSINSIR